MVKKTSAALMVVAALTIGCSEDEADAEETTTVAAEPGDTEAEPAAEEESAVGEGGVTCEAFIQHLMSESERPAPQEEVDKLIAGCEEAGDIGEHTEVITCVMEAADSDAAKECGMSSSLLRNWARLGNAE